jgi:hypothetical protein
MSIDKKELDHEFDINMNIFSNENPLSTSKSYFDRYQSP